MFTPNKTVLSLLIAALFVVTPTTQVIAQSYGGTPSNPNCLNIDKMVSNPAVTNTIEYVDNISPSDVKYQANSTAIARIKVKNTSNQVVPSVTVTDEIPSYLSYFAGPGVLSADGRILTIALGDLQTGEERYVYITYKTARPEDMPYDKSLICVINKVYAQGSICNRAEDTAQMCIEKNVINVTYTDQLKAVKTAPKAGPEMGIALLGLNGLIGTIGYILKKKSLI
ncbi:MAG: hypothetical protein WCO78_05035 [Candidatus Roizmanbacteria bacterium]